MFCLGIKSSQLFAAIGPTRDGGRAKSREHLVNYGSWLTTEAMRIFLVENHPDTLRYLRRYLLHAGHEVETAQTCAEALRGLRARPCYLLLTDLGLPDGD